MYTVLAVCGDGTGFSVDNGTVLQHHALARMQSSLQFLQCLLPATQ